MTDHITFRIPGVPIAQPRQRTHVMAIRGKAISQNYTPADHPVQAFKAAAKLVASIAYTGPLLTGPIRLTATFLFPRPGRLLWKKRDMPRCWHTGRPDRDNLEKSLCDALTGILWADDSQVCEGAVRKMFAAGDEQPGVEVEVCAL